MKELRETLKDFAQISECLDAIKFITANTEVLSVKFIEILQEELAKRNKDDPMTELFYHQLKLVEALKDLLEKFKSPSGKATAVPPAKEEPLTLLTPSKNAPTA